MSDYRILPKLELHLHIEGAAPPGLIRALAAERHIDLTGLFRPDGGYAWRDFPDFLRVYEAACTVLQTPEDYFRLTEAVLAEQAGHAVVYTEIFIASGLMGDGSLPAFADYLAAMAEAARHSAQRGGPEARFVNTCVRHFGPERARSAARIAAECAGDWLVGFGMGGNESLHRAADFTWAFDAAREAGLGLTSHAGEVEGANSVAETLDALRVSRIGHGVRAAESPDLVARLVRDGVHLEINPGSNVALRVYPALDRHPINDLLRAGVSLSVSTDDPPYFDTDLSAEYQGLANTFGWTGAEFAAINRMALDAAFCDDATRARIATRLEEKHQ